VEDLFFFKTKKKVDFFVSNRQPKGNEEKLCLRLGRGEVFLQKKSKKEKKKSFAYDLNNK